MALFHFIFELIKIAILASVYVTLILFVFRITGRCKPDGWCDRVSMKKVQFRLFGGCIISVGLFVYMFTYWGDHGMGDSAKVPIGHFKEVRQINGTDSYISKFSHEDWESRYDAMRKPVSQFDLEGRFIRTFESREQAAQSIGSKNTSSISSAIYGRVHTLGGYQWRSGIDRTPMKPVNIQPHLRKAFQRKKIAKYDIAKYDLDGNLLDIYPSVIAASRENNIELQHLYSYVRNPDRVPRKGKKFFWKYIEDNFGQVQKTFSCSCMQNEGTDKK